MRNVDEASQEAPSLAAPRSPLWGADKLSAREGPAVQGGAAGASYDGAEVVASCGKCSGRLVHAVNEYSGFGAAFAPAATRLATVAAISPRATSE